MIRRRIYSVSKIYAHYPSIIIRCYYYYSDILMLQQVRRVLWPPVLVEPESDASAPDALPFGQDFLQASTEQGTQEVGQDFLLVSS